jgi:hypothetical protein
MLLTKYNYRYIKPNTEVYILCKNVRMSLPHREFYTCPLVRQGHMKNVMVGFVGNEYAVKYSETFEDCEVTKVELTDLQAISRLMRLPCVVITNIYCNLEDQEEQSESDEDPTCFEIFFKDYVAQSTKEFLDTIVSTINI